MAPQLEGVVAAAANPCQVQVDAAAETPRVSSRQEGISVTRDGQRRSSSSGASDQLIPSLQMNSKKCPPPSGPQTTSTGLKTAAVARQQDQDEEAPAAAAGPKSRPSPSSRQEAEVALIEVPPPPGNKTSGKKPPRVFDPSGSLCYHWSMVVSFAFLYNFWSLSYRFAFREIDFDTVAFWFALDYSADLIYILDVVINFHTGYLEDGVLQRNIDKIGQHYRECTLFYLDCFCLLPLDILYLSIGFNSILRCTRLVKIYKFWSYADRTERHTNYPNVFRTFTLVHYILVIFHWNACLFHMISKNKILDIENLYKINDNRCEDILCQYLHAFYWSTLALTTIGDLPKPRTKGEYFYVTLELFFGLFLFASVLGHVANIVTNVSAARKEFQAKLDGVKTFMRMRRVSDELQSKVIRWFDYLWVSQKSSDEERSVACLPDRLKAEIAIHVHLDTLKRVDIFQNTEAGFLCELVLRLKPVLFSPGDYVCRKNEVGHEMYIVSKGILEVVAEGGKSVVATLKAGSYFGEISVLNVGLAGNKRTASVRSVGYSDLFCLNKQDLWDVLKNYPNAEARIRARAEERLSKLDINNKRNSQALQALPALLAANTNTSRSLVYRSGKPSGAAPLANRSASCRWQCYGCPAAPLPSRHRRVYSAGPGRPKPSGNGGGGGSSRRRQLNQVGPESVYAPQLPEVGFPPTATPLYRCPRHRAPLPSVPPSSSRTAENMRMLANDPSQEDNEDDDQDEQDDDDDDGGGGGGGGRDLVTAAPGTGEPRRMASRRRVVEPALPGDQSAGRKARHATNNKPPVMMESAAAAAGDVQLPQASRGRDHHIVTMPQGAVSDSITKEYLAMEEDEQADHDELPPVESGELEPLVAATPEAGRNRASRRHQQPAGPPLSSESMSGSCLSGPARHSSFNEHLDYGYDAYHHQQHYDDGRIPHEEEECQCRVELGESAAGLQQQRRYERRSRRRRRQVAPQRQYDYEPVPHGPRPPPAHQLYQAGPASLWLPTAAASGSATGAAGQPQMPHYIQVPLVATPSPFATSPPLSLFTTAEAAPAAAYQLLQPTAAATHSSASMSRLDAGAQNQRRRPRPGTESATGSLSPNQLATVEPATTAAEAAAAAKPDLDANCSVVGTWLSQQQQLPVDDSTGSASGEPTKSAPATPPTTTRPS